MRLFQDPQNPDYSAKPPWLALSVIMMLGFFIKAAEGYEFNGEHWQSEFSWYFHDSCPRFLKSAIEEALEKYSPAQHRFVSRSYTTPSLDNKSVMYCGEEDIRATQLSAPLNPGLIEVTEYTTAAAARRSFFKDSLKINACDVWFNSDYLDEYTPYVQTLVLHEVVGHCHGLRHSRERNAVMWWQGTHNDIHIDDFAGLTELYQVCRDKPFIDTDGNIYHPRLDIEDLLISLDDPEFDAYLGVELSGLQLANTPWPSGLYDYKASVCTA